MPYRLISQQTLMEHEVTARLADALRTAMAWPCHAGLSKGLASVLFLAESYERHLERMFDLEERGGYLELLQQSHPQLQPDLEQFILDHQRIQKRMHELLTQIRQRDVLADPCSDALFDEVIALLADIDEHNKREMQLLEGVVLHATPATAEARVL